MKVLIIGSGGREHAIAYALNKSPMVDEIHAIPGNPGIAEIGFNHSGSVEDLDYILDFVKNNQIDLTVVGPEVPLCLGIADLLEANGFKVFGPKKHAATLEGSKVFSKNFMKKHHIPTAESKEVESYEEALAVIDNFSYPVVVKADGLAAGKGVVICENYEEAKNALTDMMVNGVLSDAGTKVVIEEFLKGFECSLLCFTDGDAIIPMVSAKDHKQIFDGNVGPNTGGMGTVSPNPFLPTEMEKVLEEEILNPFMKAIKAENMDYRGVIFIGLMINEGHAKVLEFNVRFGDPETQVILLRLNSDLFEIMNAVATKSLKDIKVSWKDEFAACLVLASGGYPGKYPKGLEITGLEGLEDVVVFHAGTKLENNKLLTNGGRVLNICATGTSLEDVREKVYNAEKLIKFEGKYCRKDIGLA